MAQPCIPTSTNEACRRNAFVQYHSIRVRPVKPLLQLDMEALSGALGMVGT